MHRIYYLSTCDTCKKILQLINIEKFELIDVKQKHIEEAVLDKVAQQLGSYNSLLNTRAQKLKSLPPDEKPATESEYKKLILSDYTFLKRPLIIADEDLFAGNDKFTITQLVSKFGK